MMTFFPSFTAVQIGVPKFLYSAGERSTDIIAGWYNMIVTFLYGGVNQYGELVGNRCVADHAQGPHRPPAHVRIRVLEDPADERFHAGRIADATEQVDDLPAHRHPR